MQVCRRHRTLLLSLSLSLTQVSVLTDQVEVQGEKIRDLDSNLEHHRQKLDTTEGLLQQVGAALRKHSSDWCRCRLRNYKLRLRSVL